VDARRFGCLLGEARGDARALLRAATAAAAAARAASSARALALAHAGGAAEDASAFGDRWLAAKALRLAGDWTSVAERNRKIADLALAALNAAARKQERVLRG
jgi:hypothetical protein